MFIINPPQAKPRTQKIGRTVFNVQAYYCGYESLYKKFASLMETDLLTDTDKFEAVENTEKISLDYGGK